MIMMKEKKKKTALLSKVDRGNRLNNQEYMNKEQDIISNENSDGSNMPNYDASVSRLGGEVLRDQMIYERSQDINDENIHAQHQGILSNNDTRLS